MADSQLPQRWISATPLSNAASATTAPSEQESTLRSLLQLAALVRRHWLLVFGITAAAVGILLYRVRNEPHIYRATATIRLEDKAKELSSGISRSPAMPTYRPFND